MNRKEIVQALEEKRVTGKGDRDEEIPDFEELQMTEGEELGLGKKRREDVQGENGMRADDCPETVESEAGGQQRLSVARKARRKIDGPVLYANHL